MNMATNTTATIKKSKIGRTEITGNKYIIDICNKPITKVVITITSLLAISLIVSVILQSKLQLEYQNVYVSPDLQSLSQNDQDAKKAVKLRAQELSRKKSNY